MGSTYLSPPAKRAIRYTSTEMSDPNPYTANGFSKRSKQPPSFLNVPQGHVAFRLLCHASRIGGVIGKSGNVIKQLQESTGAKIRVEIPQSESPDRVITVVAPSVVNSKVSIEVNSANNSSTGTGNFSNGNGDFEGRFGIDSNGELKEEFDVSKAQEALLRVFERILEVAAETDGLEAGVGVVSCRLLVEINQVGSVIGKGGKVVEKIRKDSGCRIRVLKEKLPVCAGPNDKMVEIEGEAFAIKKALVAVSRRLQDCPPVDRTRAIGSQPAEAVPQETLRRPFETIRQETLLRPLEAVSQEILPDLRVDLLSHWTKVLPSKPSNSINYASGVGPMSLEFDRVSSLDTKTLLPSKPNSSINYTSGVSPASLEFDRFSSLDTKLQHAVVFKILCSTDRTGGVIGKGGAIVRVLQNESGASICIGATMPDCDERLITVTASENPELGYSAAQKAVVLVFSRSVEAGIEKGLDSESSKGAVTARLVVPSDQVGCLLGKGGAIIAEMRKVTGTSIRIIGGDQAPKCVSESDQVVQISGEFSKVKDAVYHVTGRMRDNLFSSVLNSAGTRSSGFATTESSPYAKLWDPAPLGLHSSVGITHNLSRQTNLTDSMDNLGLSHRLDRPASPRLWTSESQKVGGINLRGVSGAGVNLRGISDIGMNLRGISDVGGVNLRGLSDLGRNLTSLKGGLELGSGSRSAIVTNTTVEIVVPENVIGSVYGENGSNLTRLRQISGAKVIVHEPRLGSTDRIIVISGTPDETQAAQSLLQAFILAGSS